MRSVLVPIRNKRLMTKKKRQSWGKAMESKAGSIHRTEEARAIAVPHLACCCRVTYGRSPLGAAVDTHRAWVSTDLSFLIH